MDQNTLNRNVGNQFNNTADPPPNPFYPNHGIPQNNTMGGQPLHHTPPLNADPNLASSSGNGNVPLLNPEDMCRMLMNLNQSLTMLLTDNQNTRAKLDELAKGRMTELTREASVFPPPPPLSVHTEVPPPFEHLNKPKAMHDPVNNWLQQDPIDQAPPQMQPIHEPYRDPYYEPVRRPMSIQGEGPSPMETHRVNKNLSELKEQVKVLTQKMAESLNDLTQMQSYNLYPEARYPMGFKMPSIPKFTGTTPPELHLKSYVRSMRIYDIGEVELANSFHLTLAGPAQSWFLNLEKHRVRSWSAIVQEFVAQYKTNEELKVTRKHLEMAKQKEGESINEFVTRWRELAAQMVERLDEEEQLGMIVKNLKPEIRTQMGHQFFGKFKALLHVGNEIEEELAKQAKTKKSASQYKKTSTSAINQVTSYGSFGRGYFNSPYDQNSVKNVGNYSALGYSTLGYRNNNNNSRAFDQNRSRDKHFSQLPGPLGKVYEQLKEVGIIYPVNPRPLP
ncbi:hypothetical protein LguiB_026903 [Lonicera macranthoides]